jgi:hypothetical protein
MAHAVDADHQRPLGLGHPYKKVLRVATKGREHRQEQEDIDRHENRIHAVPVDQDKVVLQRQDDEEAGEQGPVVGPIVRGEGEKLAQGGEGCQRKEKDDAGLSREEGDGEQEDHHPPGGDAGVQVLDHRVFAGRRETKAQDFADGRGEDEDAADTREEPQEMRAGHV